MKERDRKEETEKQYKLALEAAPEDIHWNYGILLEELGRKEEAAMQYILALKDSSDNV